MLQEGRGEECCERGTGGSCEDVHHTHDKSWAGLHLTTFWSWQGLREEDDDDDDEEDDDDDDDDDEEEEEEDCFS